MDKARFLIFTDGACSGNPGPGGWGSIVLQPDGIVKELGGSNPQTTNNRMEIVASLRALMIIEPVDNLAVTVYTDSKYLIESITKWIKNWRRRGWKSSTGGDVANRDLWEELSREVTRLEPCVIDWKYVRGHDGNPGNERCDQIAVSFSKNKPEQLYTGPVDGYFVDLTDLPETRPIDGDKNPRTTSGASIYGDPIPGASKSTASKYGSKNSPAGSVWYLSLLNGVRERHKTWSECERRVKGKNAKFKKVKSKQEEDDTFRSWGVQPLE